MKPHLFLMSKKFRSYKMTYILHVIWPIKQVCWWLPPLEQQIQVSCFFKKNNTVAMYSKKKCLHTDCVVHHMSVRHSSPIWLQVVTLTPHFFGRNTHCSLLATSRVHTRMLLLAKRLWWIFQLKTWCYSRCFKSNQTAASSGHLDDTTGAAEDTLCFSSVVVLTK